MKLDRNKFLLTQRTQPSTPMPRRQSSSLANPSQYRIPYTFRLDLKTCRNMLAYLSGRMNDCTSLPLLALSWVSQSTPSSVHPPGKIAYYRWNTHVHRNSTLHGPLTINKAINPTNRLTTICSTGIHFYRILVCKSFHD